MKLVEYEAMREHVLDFMSLKELEAQLDYHRKNFDCDTPYRAASKMVQDGCFECYFDTAFRALKQLYGSDFKESTYLNKDGSWKYKDGEAYVWNVYKHKVAIAIEKMIQRGEIKWEEDGGFENV